MEVTVRFSRGPSEIRMPAVPSTALIFVTIVLMAIVGVVTILTRTRIRVATSTHVPFHPLLGAVCHVCHTRLSSPIPKTSSRPS